MAPLGQRRRAPALADAVREIAVEDGLVVVDEVDAGAILAVGIEATNGPEAILGRVHVITSGHLEELAGGELVREPLTQALRPHPHPGLGRLAGQAEAGG